MTNTATDRLTGWELMSTREHMIADPEFDPDYSQILDLSGVTAVDVTAADIRELAAQTGFSSRSRRAHVVTDPLQYGLLRMFQAYTGDRGGEIRIFATLRQAEAWLFDGDPGE